ncbi:MAG: hypothetical protein U5K33_01530 [Halofilum sp. (in: g-proteobacteria)]|nr:hypothetical protein [Halofilum sp. (in: g-proteobacteria)]
MARMDFFERQERARRSTTVLVLVFVLAVIAIVLAVDAVVWGALLWADRAPADPLAWMRTETAWLVTGVTVAVLLGGSAWRWFQLAHGGGGRVAILMGGRIVDPDTKDPQENACWSTWSRKWRSPPASPCPISTCSTGNRRSTPSPPACTRPRR